MTERNVGGLRCSEVLAVLSDYVDGDLDEPTERKVEAHLVECANCERFGRDFGKMLVQMRQKLAKAEAVDEALLERLRKRLP